MTPDELRIRCAELSGWEEIRGASPHLFGGEPITGCRKKLPKFTESIDAINAAVLRLNEDDQFEWTMELQKILMEKHKMAAGYLTKEIATASAIDRAKAFAAIHS